MSFRLWNLTQDHEVAISRIRDLNQQNCYDLTESQKKQLNIAAKATMGYLVVLVFVITILLAFIEPYMKKYKAILYLFIGMVLILIAGLREVGIDPDSRNYEYTYLH